MTARRAGLGLVQKTAQASGEILMVAVKITGADQPKVVFPAADLALLPGEPVQALQIGPQGDQLPAYGLGPLQAGPQLLGQPLDGRSHGLGSFWAG